MTSFLPYLIIVAFCVLTVCLGRVVAPIYARSKGLPYARPSVTTAEAYTMPIIAIAGLFLGTVIQALLYIHGRSAIALWCFYAVIFLVATYLAAKFALDAGVAKSERPTA
jgi:hypothetical protein